MVAITWSLDDDGQLEPEEPLGSILITGSTGFIMESATFLDLYFEALVAGVVELLEKSEVSVEVIDESHDIRLKRLGGGAVQIEYGKQSAIIDSFEEFYSALRVAVRNFVEKVDSNVKKIEKPILDMQPLRSFAHLY